MYICMYTYIRVQCFASCWLREPTDKIRKEATGRLRQNYEVSRRRAYANDILRPKHIDPENMRRVGRP